MTQESSATRVPSAMDNLVMMDVALERVVENWLKRRKQKNSASERHLASNI
jgi:hypothetical protein